MKEFLYMIVGWIAEIHSYLMRFNDSYEYNFSDKELHFIVIGLLGMAFVFIILPQFRERGNKEFSGLISDLMDIRGGRSFRCRLRVVHR